MVIVLCAGLPTDTPAAEDLSRLIAELSQAWQQGRSKDIADRFDEALQRITQDHRVHKAYGDFLTANRRNQEALTAYWRAAELAPDALDVHWATWSLLDRLGAQDQAILRLKEIVRLDPNNPLAHLRLAKALRNVDRLEESVDSFRRAVELNPEHDVYRLQYARALFDVLRYDEARREVETLREALRKRDADAFVARGEQLGKIVAATRDDWREDYLRDALAAEARLDRAPVILPPGRLMRGDRVGGFGGSLNAARTVSLARTGRGSAEVDPEDLAAYERALAAGRVVRVSAARG